MSNAVSRRREREEDDENERRVQPRSSTSHLPPCVIGLAYRNRKHRFFVPSTNNSFAGIGYPYVMVASGCNSFLLPFPQVEASDGSFVVDAEALAPFLGNEYVWTVSSSGGTGAVGSRTLRIEYRSDIRSVGEMRLAFSKGVPLDYLRFHLGSSAANLLKDHPKLIENHQQSLRDFLTGLGDGVSKERQHVLLGQYYLDRVCCIQNGSIMFMVDRNVTDIDVAQVTNQCDEFARPLVISFDGFDDLEDEDHDGDDNEDRRLSWDPSDYIDETN
ncbi:hypothetical protein ACA910_001893 [Epithemia clementina (nom. ined.)]